MRKIVVFALALGLMVTACSKKRALVTRGRLPQIPASIPKVENKIDPALVRTEVSKLVLQAQFEEAIQQKGLYTPDVCFQLAKFTKGTTEIGTYLEMSSVTCPASGLVAEADVLLRIKMNQSAQFNTQYRLQVEMSASPEVGAIRKVENNGVTEYRLEGLCDIDTGGYNEGWDTFCTIAIENSLLRNPDPLDLYNLD